MKYAIIENEEYARLKLQHSIEELRPEYECAFTAESVSESIRKIQSESGLQLIFMDIELDDG
ncbi:MAG: DNA-binding response regulator, partial [Bacteroides sp.]|nr:DNA-binding response regulator [Bacteroides sp.]